MLPNAALANRHIISSPRLVCLTSQARPKAWGRAWGRDEQEVGEGEWSFFKERLPAHCSLGPPGMGSAVTPVLQMNTLGLSEPRALSNNYGAHTLSGSWLKGTGPGDTEMTQARF